MIALWMLYAFAVGALMCAAAATVEQLFRVWRIPVRGVWAVAMLLTLGIPLLGRLAPAPPAEISVAAEGVTAAQLPADRLPVAVAPGIGDRARMAASALAVEIRDRAGRFAAAAAPLDGALAAAWLLASLCFGVLLARSALRLRRRSREWQAATIQGVDVLVAPDAGPAVMGKGSIVIPSWMLELDESLRRMVLRHELEHVRAGDPRLLLGAVAITIGMPWNPALWWQLRRLRTAVELDCDQRVLRVHRDVERYGLLLLAVGQRTGAPLRLGAPALAESTGSLERRIAVMTAPPARRRQAAIRALLALPMAAGLGAAACMMPSPNAVAGPELVPPPAEQRSPSMPQPSQAFFEFQVEKPVEQLPGGAPRYPADLRAQGVSGTVIAQFVVDTVGVVETSTFKVLESSHELFSEAIRDALPSMRFVPAEVEGRRVRQLVQQPFVFQVDREGGNLQPTRAPSVELAPLMRAGERSPAPARVPDLEGRVPLRTDQLRPAMRTPGPTGERQRAYFEFEVEKPAVRLAGAAPRYPAELQAQRATGEAIVQFVVDAEGRPDQGTFQVISATHDAFAAAVRDALATMRFSPAQVAGRRVPQVVQMPFVFEIR